MTSVALAWADAVEERLATSQRRSVIIDWQRVHRYLFNRCLSTLESNQAHSTFEAFCFDRISGAE